MPNKPDINKRQVGLRVPLEIDAAVLREFKRAGDSNDSVAYIRALEEATREVELTAEDLLAIAKKKTANKQKRG